MRLARPENHAYRLASQSELPANPNQLDADEAARLLEELNGDDDDILDERNKKPHRTKKKE